MINRLSTAVFLTGATGKLKLKWFKEKYQIKYPLKKK